MDVSEKIDGSNLMFGFDETGNFYTTRRNKGRPKRYYDSSEYEPVSVNNVFLAAHKVLKFAVGDMPIPGKEFEVEVLFGRQPNAIVYGSNRIVFIDKYPHPLPTSSVQISSSMVFSDDGIKTFSVNVQSEWTLNTIPRLNLKDINIPSECAKEEIKDILVNQILRNIQPAFRDVGDLQPHEDFGVEGIVIRDPESETSVKLVDRQTFTLINQFNFAIRNELKSAGPRFNPTSNQHMYTTFAATVGYVKASIFDSMLHDMSDLIGISGLSRYMGITRTLKKYRNVDEFILSWKIHNFESGRSCFIHSAQEALNRLEVARTSFIHMWKSYTLELTSGRTIRYTDEIYKRTIVTFAEIRKELTNIMKNIAQSSNLVELAMAVYGKQMRLAFPEV